MFLREKLISSVFLAVAVGLSMNVLGESRTSTLRRLLGEVNDAVVVFLNFFQRSYPAAEHQSLYRGCSCKHLRRKERGSARRKEIQCVKFESDITNRTLSALAGSVLFFYVV